VQLTVRVKPAHKARMGRNPPTGEAIKVAAKPASVDVRAVRWRRQGRAAQRAESRPAAGCTEGLT
jgi:hypothetical protein